VCATPVFLSLNNALILEGPPFGKVLSGQGPPFGKYPFSTLKNAAGSSTQIYGECDDISSRGNCFLVTSATRTRSHDPLQFTFALACLPLEPCRDQSAFRTRPRSSKRPTRRSNGVGKSDSRKKVNRKPALQAGGDFCAVGAHVPSTLQRHLRPRDAGVWSSALNCSSNLEFQLRCH
jgi:hypothetical protein